MELLRVLYPTKGLVVFCLVLSILGFGLFAPAQETADPKMIMEGAKKEGQVVWYTIMTLDQAKQVADRFQEKYPFSKPVIFRTDGPLLNKILTEAQAWAARLGCGPGKREILLPLMQGKLLTAYRSPETKI